MIPNAADRFDADGNLVDDKSRQLIAQLLQSLVAWTLRLKD
jgi:chromate reductase